MNSDALARFVVAALVVTGLCVVQPAQAANWLNEVLQFSSAENVQEIEVVLGTPLTLTSEFESLSSREFRARAAPVGQVDAGWQFAELFFDEKGDNLEKLTFAGSAAKGFAITLKFREPVALETVPQYSPRRLSVIFMSLKNWQKLSRSAKKPAPEQGPVAIRLESPGLLDVGAVTPDIARTRLVYRNPQAQNEVRIGFFTTRTAATVALRALRGEHPSASLTTVSAAEVEYAKAFNLYTDRLLAHYDLGPDQGAPAATDGAAPVLAVKSITPSSIAAAPEVAPAAPVRQEWSAALDRSILDQAQDAYTDGDYPAAISFYTKAGADPRMREEAMEMLGVARERNGQLAHAKAEYERFLAEYPGSGAYTRVEQRLRSLIGTDAPAPVLRSSDVSPSASWYTVGNLSQFYQRYSLDIDDQQTSVPIDGLFTDANVIARRQSATASHELRLSGGHIWDFSDDDDSAARLHRLTWASFFDNLGLGFKIGRQSDNNAGILGRFDGVTLSWRQNDSLQWNLVGGYVAQSTYDNPTTDRPVYGVNAELSLLDGNLEFSPFFVEHKRDGIVDRRAVGIHAHYFTDRATISNLTDYDIYHQVLNNFIVNVNYNLTEAWRFSGSYDFRRSPYLTTSNALIGQRYDDLSELEQSLIDMKLDELAEDRTAEAHMMRGGLFGELNDTWSVSLDGSASRFSDTAGSLGVIGLDDRTDYYLTAQVRAEDLFSENTFTSMQARYMASETSESTMLYFTNRFSLANWFVFPKLVLAQRTFKNNDQDQTQILPSLRMDYRGFKRIRLEMEMGYEWTTRETIIDDTDIKGLFFRVGYRTLF